ncbi:MAG: hypothetical protein DWB56_05035 [Candidatus Jettenia sp.]|uniref:Putative acyltransferase n=1 Tax=Candidatus Jettenia caeni TaxID=247490 RepID=I3IIS8_9BACT|nr:MAG: hypothetical protein EDM77_02595 [Candidatus Jettenia sp. AMX1]MBC6928320.1 hypothetical protein [Candidatus Jettenia sp.]GAB61623.1 putative acyltransferase [Candidatus Jettenia caeni]MCE7880687.1 hypothetical protein [Candidatus Jettenia sp. AMX1]MCQ3926385.1 hypothetical protein [Candidatus Jettenia sp.]
MGLERDLVSYLKGFSIIIIILHHYIINYLPDHFNFFGNHFVAIFFILSGYGIYYSLNNNSHNNGNLLPFLSKFYWKRAIRIYPLYWLWFFLDQAGDKNSHVSLSSLLDFFLLRITDPPDHWFLHALIPCYIISPVFFSLLEKYHKAYLPIIIGTFILLNPLLYYIGVPEVRTWKYVNLYLTHVLLFSLGMYIPSFQYLKQLRQNRIFLFGLFLCMIFSFFQTSSNAFFYRSKNYEYLFIMLFIASTFSFTFYFIHSNINPPLYSFMKKIGIYTYSLYIFHGMYFTVLCFVHIIKNDSYASLMLTIVLFPLFFVCCGFLEELFYNRLKFRQAYKKCKNKVMY